MGCRGEVGDQYGGGGDVIGERRSGSGSDSLLLPIAGAKGLEEVASSSKRAPSLEGEGAPVSWKREDDSLDSVPRPAMV